MKKKILSAFGIALLATSANAQIFFSEDFNGTSSTSPSTKFTQIDADGDGNKWGAFNETTFPSQGMIYTSASAFQGPLTPDNWLITTPIDLSTADSNTVLTWKVYAQDQSWVAEKYGVYISNNSNTVADFTTAGSVFNETLTTSTGYMSRSVNLAAYAGDTVYIAFRHHGVSNQFRMNIDDIIVKTPLRKDAELTMIATDTFYSAAGNKDITGLITNNGLDTITDLDVIWDDGSGPQTHNLTGLNIPYGATYAFTHNIQLNTVPDTTYQISVKVILAGDLLSSNDSLNHSIEIAPLNDAELTSLDIAEYAASGIVDIKGAFINNGGTPITAIDITWNDGSGPQTQNVTGLSIAYGASYTFAHTTQLNVVGGTNYALDVKIDLVGDADTTNNTLTTSVIGLTQIPTKIVVGEENTGAWCQYCPAGSVMLSYMEAKPNFIGIAVHNADPMEIPAYNAGASTYFPDFNGFPNAAVDRVIGNHPVLFDSIYTVRENDVVPCEVKNIVATINNSSGKISVSADAEFFGNITGDFRMSCVIIEDDVIGSGSGWNQANAFSGRPSPVVDPLSNFDWAAAGNSVNPTAFGGYDHVARSLSSNDILGDAGSLTSNPTIGVQNYSFTDVNSSLVDNYAKAHAVVMIVNSNTGEILNAAKAGIVSPTYIDEAELSNFNLKVFPNPTNNISTISFKLDEASTVSMKVLNSVGSLVYSVNKGTMNAGLQQVTFNGNNLPNGIYFVNIKVGQQSIVKKVSLIK